MDSAHAKSISEVLDFFSVSEAHGLSDDGVKNAQDKYGKNCK